MKRGRSTGTPTKAQQARFDAIKGGHDFTVGLCPWHHRGDHSGNTPALMTEVYGPSYARQPKAFREVFGDDAALLAFQDELLTGRQAA